MRATNGFRSLGAFHQRFSRTAATLPLFLAIPITSALAQTNGVRVTGAVQDSIGAPVTAAEIAAGEQRTRTNDSGRFELTGIQAGTFTITVRRIGFVPRTVDTTVVAAADASSFEMLVVLAALPADLDPVRAVASNRDISKLGEFDRRRARGFGSFVTRDQIERRRPVYLSDMMRNLPGMMVTPASIGGYTVRVGRTGQRSGCRPDYYIDGIHAPGFELDLIPPQDVDGIEIYRGPATIPPDYRHRTSGCGVIAIWTYDPADPHGR